MRLDTNNAASILIDGNPYKKDLLKITYNSNNITIRDQYGLVYDTVAYSSITNGLTNVVFTSLTELKQWVSDHLFSSDTSSSACVTVVLDTAFSMCRGVYIGSSGDVSAVVGSTTLLFKNAPAGSILPIRATKINTTGTTASNLIALL